VGNKVSGDARKKQDVKVVAGKSWKEKCVAKLLAIAGEKSRSALARKVATNTANAIKSKIKFHVFEDLEQFAKLSSGRLRFIPPKELKDNFAAQKQPGSELVQIPALGDVIGLGYPGDRSLIVRRTQDLSPNGTPYEIDAAYVALVAHEANHALSEPYFKKRQPPAEFKKAKAPQGGWDAHEGWEKYRYFLFELRATIIQDLLDPTYNLAYEKDVEARENLLLSFGKHPIYSSDVKPWTRFINFGEMDQAPSEWDEATKQMVYDYWYTNFIEKGAFDRFGNFTNA
jgi:hypothetical protein